MRASTGVGFAIAAFVAVAVLGVSMFGDRHEDWLLRAAQDAAVRCVSEGACARIDGRGEVVRGTKLAAGSTCTTRSGWHVVVSDKKRPVPFIVTCTDGASYLFHMGKFRDAGEAQVMICAEARCVKEARLFAN